MKKKLPIKLQDEPLIEALFEVRFNSDQPASLISGYLFAKMPNASMYEELAAAGIPKQLKAQSPELQYAPTHKFNADGYTISFSNKSVIINTPYPYSGWSKFKQKIIELLNFLVELKSIKSIERYSLKYVDLIEGSSIEEQIGKVNVSLAVANHTIEQEFFRFRVDILRNNYINIIELVSSSTVTLPDKKTKNGFLISVDSISTETVNSFEDLITGIDASLEAVHSVNKEVFFDCLKEETIQSMRPDYE